MAESSLKLGNVFNRVTAGNEEEQARSRALGGAFSAAADALQGKGYEPGMSGFEFALGQAARGASQGFMSKADIQKAQAQDEMNAWAKSLADYERQVSVSTAQAEKEQQAVKQIAIPAMAARIEYSKTGDKQAYESRMRALASTYAQLTGRELTQAHLDPENDGAFNISLKDADGEIDTQKIDLLSTLSGFALEQDEEIARQGIAAFGIPIAQEEKLSTTQTKLRDAEAALGRPLTEQERMGLVGIRQETPTEDAATRRRKDNVAKILDDPAKSPILKSARTSQQAQVVAQRIIDSGFEGGFGTNILADVASAFGTALNIEGAREFATDVETLRSGLAPLIFSAVSNLGSGTGISNKDLEFAERAAGGINNTAESLLYNMALARALAEKDAAGYEIEQAWLNNEIDTPERDRLMRELRNIDATDQDLGISSVTDRYFNELMARYSQRKSGRAAPEAPTGTTIRIDENGNIIQ